MAAHSWDPSMGAFGQRRDGGVVRSARLLSRIRSQSESFASGGPGASYVRQVPGARSAAL